MTTRRSRHLFCLPILICVLLMSAAFRCGTVAASPPIDPISVFWLDYLSTEYGIAEQEILKLKEQGMAWQSISALLEEAYPHGRIKIDTSDCVELASRTGVSAGDAVKAYEFAMIYRVEPQWLAGLYRETRDWGSIQAAFKRRDEARRMAFSTEAKAPGQSARQEVSSRISSVYGIPQFTTDRVSMAGMNADDLIDALFVLDATCGGDAALLSQRAEQLPADWKELIPELAPLRKVWPERSFPVDLIPLLSDKKGAASPAASADSQFSYPSLAQPGVEPYGLAGDGPVPREGGVRSTSGDEPSPSLVDPEEIYNCGQVSPFEAYLDGFSETVVPASGALVIRQTDFTLPGRAGLDFSLTRIYNNQLALLEMPRIAAEFDCYIIGDGSWATWGYLWSYYGSDGSRTDYYEDIVFEYGMQNSYDGTVSGIKYVTVWYFTYDEVGHLVDRGSATDVIYPCIDSPDPDDILDEQWDYYGLTTSYAFLDDRCGFGVGWSLSLPALEHDNEVIFLHMDGQTYKICKGEQGISYYIDEYGLNDLEFLYDTSYLSTADGIRSKYRLIRKDGVSWSFDENGRLMRIIDRFGNAIYVEYRMPNGSISQRIQRILDTVGREITFAYSPSQVTVTVNPKDGSSSAVWSYQKTMTYYREHLVGVTPPDGPPVRYEYQTGTTTFTGWIEGLGTTDPVSYRSANLTAIYHQGQYSSSAVSRYTYTTLPKHMTDDPDDTSEYRYFAVQSRWDEADTIVAGQPTVIDKVYGKAQYGYSVMDGELSYTLRVPLRSPGSESGSTPAREEWWFDEEHRTTRHKVTGYECGPNSETETVATDYTYPNDSSKLPSQDVVTISLGTNSRTETTQYAWDDFGGLVKKVDPAGAELRYAYHPSYHIRVLEVETTSTGMPKQGRVTEYKLQGPVNRTIREKSTFMGELTESTVQTHTGTPVAEIPEDTSWYFSPPGDITAFRLKVTWSTKNAFDWATYSVYYRRAGASAWTKCAGDTHGGWIGGKTSYDMVDIGNLPQGWYEIRVSVTNNKVGIGLAEAYGPLSGWVPLDASKVSTVQFDYHASYPWLVTRATEFGSQGSIESVTDYGYDGGRLAQPSSVDTGVTLMPSGATHSGQLAAYDGFGRIKRLTAYANGASSGSETNYGYDDIGRLTSVTPSQQHAGGPGTVTRARAYEDAQSRVVLTDELGNRTRQAYDGLGRFVLAEWEDEYGQWHQSAHVQRDSLGRTVSEFDALMAHEVTHTYDSLGRETRTEYPKSDPSDPLEVRPFVQVTYCSVSGESTNPPPEAGGMPSPPAELGQGRFPGMVRWVKTETLNEPGQPPAPRYNGYDISGRVIWSAALTGPYGSWDMVWYKYDCLGRVQSMWAYREDAGGNPGWDRTDYAYADHFDEPTSMAIYRDGQASTPIIDMEYAYDRRGLRISESVKQGGATADRTRMAYDEIGRLKLVEYGYPNVANVVEYRYGYDHAQGRALTTVNLYEKSTPTGTPASTVTAAYNRRGWMESETWVMDGATYVMGYQYDDAGNRTDMTYPNGTSLDFQYDERRQLLRIPGYFEDATYPSQAGFRYDANGFLTGMTSVNGVITSCTADGQGRVNGISASKLMPNDIMGLEYSYSPAGNISSIDDLTNMDPALEYSYDWIGRLTSADIHGYGVPGKYEVAYQYDGAGNRIRESWTDGVQVNYSYNAANQLTSRGEVAYAWGSYGQLLSKTEGSEVVTYHYNPRRLMDQVKVGVAEVANYSYDALGRRVKSVEGDATTVTLCSGNDVVYEVRASLTGPATTTCYLTVNGNTLAKTVREGTDPAETFFLHTDMVGSIRALTDSTGEVVARFEYEPFGLTTQASGALASETHKFTGKPEDGTGLYYYGARYYDPEVGRFTTADAAQQGLNWYQYCAGNPLIHVDPDGNTYVILWSYGWRDLIPFTGPQGMVDWGRFERENSFSRAANTRRFDLAVGGEDWSNIMVRRIDSADALESIWMELAKLERVDGLNMYSHGNAEDGPDVAGSGTSSVWEKIIDVSLKWTDDATAVFHGCNTAEFAERFAYAQHVTTYGQQGFSSFSPNAVIHTRISSDSRSVYLYHFDYFNLFNTNGWGVKYGAN